MHGPRDQYERLIRRAGPRLCFRRMGRRASPGVIFSVDEGQSVVADIVPAVCIDNGGVGWSGDVERVAADDGLVFESDGAGDERELVLGDAGACLEESPLAAVLVRPAPPCLSDVVHGVEGGVVGGVAFIRCLPSSNAGLDEGDVDVGDEV